MMDRMSEWDREGEKIKGNWRRKGSKRATVREGEQKGGRRRQRDRRRKSKREKESRVMKMKGRPRRWGGPGHQLPALEQLGLKDGLWRNPDICLQVRTTASLGRT